MNIKLILSTVFFAVVSYGQSSINSFYVDENANFAVVFSPTELDQTASGPNQTWNFDQLVSTSTSNYSTLAPSSSELSTFPNTTNVVVSTFNTVPTSTSQMFIRDLANQISITGLRAAGLELNFSTNNASLGTFPLSYGYSNTDPVAGNYIYDTYSGTFTGNMVTSVDAHGSLYRNVGAIPNSNATRLKVVITISINYGFFTNVGTIKQTIYSYYQDPLISADGLLFRTTITEAEVPLIGIDERNVSMESYMGMSLGTETNLVSDVQFRVAPNPVSNLLNFTGIDINTQKSVTIIDEIGRVVLYCDNCSNTIEVSQLRSGIYFAKVETAGKSITKKFVKE